MPTAKTHEVADALKYFVELNPNLKVDNGYVVMRRTEDYVRTGQSEQAIVVYAEEIRDTSSLILNPFAEGLGMTPTASWFYKTLRTPMQVRICLLLQNAIQMALSHKETSESKTSSSTPKKKKQNEEDISEGSHTPQEVLNIVSGVVNDVDNKMLEEIGTKLVQNASELFQIVYYRNTQTTQFRSTLLYDPEHVRELLGIRKKTITVLNKILKALFDVGTHDELVDKYKARHMKDAPSRMSSYLKCLYNVYDVVNPIMVHFGDSMAISDMESFDYHLQRLPEYTMNAKFMVSPSAPETSNTQQQQSVPTANVPLPNQQHQQQPNMNKTPSGVPLPQQNTPNMAPMGGHQNVQPMQQPYQQTNNLGLVSGVQNQNMMPQQQPGFMPQQQPGVMPQQQQQPGFMPQQQQQPGFMPQQQQQQQYVNPQAGTMNAPPAWKNFI